MFVSWHGDAGEEFSEAAAYYEEQDIGLGERFIVHIEAAVAKLRSAPLIPRCFDGECRKVRLEKFPYAVIYRIGQEAVQIIAVMHLSRRPGYLTNSRRRTKPSWWPGGSCQVTVALPEPSGISAMKVSAAALQLIKSGDHSGMRSASSAPRTRS